MFRCPVCGILQDKNSICECCLDDGVMEDTLTDEYYIIHHKMQKVWDALRNYQKDGIKTMQTRLFNLNYDDMGLGKTIVTLYSAIQKAKYLFSDRNLSRLDFAEHILIVCPKKALYVWKEEITKWFNLESIIYSGTVTQRKKLLERDNNGFCELDFSPFIITTYGMLEELKDKLNWCGIIADEIHEAGLLNHKTKTYKTFEGYIKRIKWFYLLTGTPIRQGVIDCYAPLHLVAPDIFKNYWSFVNSYCIVTNTPFGKQIERNPRDIKGFRKMLDKYMVRRLKSEVLKDLPGKQRQPIILEMTKKQAKAHQDVLKEFVYNDEDTLVVSQNAMTAMLRARQILVTPRLLGIDEDGAAFDYLKEEGKYLLESNKPFVVFTPFRQAIPLIEDLINSIGMGTKIYTITGGLKPSEFANQWQGFMQDLSTNKVLLCVIKSGASFHATVASDCFFLGYEWDFNLNSQAEDRLCRLGQTNFVNCRYLLHKDTVDENVKERLNDKNNASNWIIGTEQQYQLMLKSVRSKVLK